MSQFGCPCLGRFAIIWWCCSCWVTAVAQSPVYLHTDRWAYSPGDTIWFSAYTVSDTVSQTLYVELLSPDREKVGERLFRLTKGQAPGFWPLSDTLTIGPYRLRAYTRLGALTDMYDSKLLWLTARNSRLVEPPPADSNRVIQVTAEGGGLTHNLPASVVIRVTDAEEQAVQTEGILMDNQQQVVANFQTDRLGLARVFFTPRADQMYQVKVGDDLLELPKVRLAGISLLLDAVSQPDGIKVRLFRSRPVPDSLRIVSLLVMAGDSVCFATADSSETVALTVRVPVNRLPAGVIRFVVLDQHRRLLAERYAWSRLPPLPQLRLTGRQLTPDGRLKLDIQLTDSRGNGIQGHLSVSVTDSSRTAYTETDGGGGVLRCLLPGLPTRLRHPARLWPQEQRQSLDRYLTTLTRWPQMVADSLAEKGLFVEGIAQNDRNKPLANQTLLLLDNRSRNTMTIQTSEHGQFGFSYPLQSDTVSLVVQQLDAKNRPQPTQINWLHHPVPDWQDEGPLPALARLPGPVALADTAVQVQDGKLLQALKVRARRQLVRDLYVADYSIQTTDKYLEKAGTNTALHLMNYLINQPEFIRFAKSEYANRRDALLSRDPATSAPIDPYQQGVHFKVLIDNRLHGDVQDANNQLMSLSAYAIERVEIVRALMKPVVLVSGELPRLNEPILAIITRMGPYGSGLKAYSSQVVQYRQAGYSRVVAFNTTNRRGQPTLFWRSDLETNAAGEVSVLMDAPKSATTVLITVEGKTYDGRPISASWRLPVEW